MNCSNWEERIALYAGGDLPAEDAAAVEHHLGECPGCQVFASGVKESVGLLRAAGQEPLPDAYCSAVRARVLATLESRQRPWWRSSWAYGCGAALLAFLWFLMVPAPPRKTAQSVAHRVLPVHQAPAEPAPVAVPLPVVSPVRTRPFHATSRRPKVRTLPAATGSPVIVKMLTDDPDVVIYWISDNSGE